MMNPIDLCYICVDIVYDEMLPTRERHLNGNPTAYNMISYEDVRIMNETGKTSTGAAIIAPEALPLPMIAMVTIAGSRVCGQHTRLQIQRMQQMKLQRH